MKKKLLLLLTGLLVTFHAAGCGQNTSKTTDTETDTGQSEVITGYLIENAAQYVTLGSCKGLAVDKPVYEVTEEDVNIEIDNALYEASELVSADRKSQSGDIITMDLKAVIEGEEEPYFEEEDYAVELGYEEFGAEFDEALEGCEIGESKTISCSYDEDTWYEDWIDQTVTFDVTIKNIEEIVIPEYDDAFAKEMGYDSQEDYEAYLKEMLTESYAEQSSAQAQNNALMAAMEEASFSGYPDKLYDSCASSVKEQYTYFAEAYGMSEEELYEAYGMSEEDIETEILETVNTRLFLSAFCQQESITITDEEYHAFIEEQYALYGYDDAASFEEEYGKEYILWVLYESKAASYLLENASVTEVEDSYYEEEDDEEDYGEELDSLEEESEAFTVTEEDQNGE